MSGARRERLRAVRRGAGLLLGLSVLAAPAAAHPSWGLVVEPQGAVVFTDVDHNTVWRWEPGGGLVAIARGVHSHELYRGTHGTLYGEHVAWDAPRERWLASLWRITSEGRLEELSPLAVEGPQGRALLRDAAGWTYAFVAGGTGGGRALVRHGADGEATVVARTAAPVLAAVSGKAWGPAGALFVTDGATVRRIASAGAVSTLGGDPLAGVSHGERPRLLGLAVGAAGEVYVADYDHHLVRAITPGGAVRTIWSSGPLWSPSGVAASGPDLYVLEHRPERLVPLGWIGPAARLRRLTLDTTGRRRFATTLVTVGGSGGGVAVAVVGSVVVVGVAILAVRRVRRKVSG